MVRRPGGKGGRLVGLSSGFLRGGVGRAGQVLVHQRAMSGHHAQQCLHEGLCGCLQAQLRLEAVRVAPHLPGDRVLAEDGHGKVAVFLGDQGQLVFDGLVEVLQPAERDM